MRKAVTEPFETEQPQVFTVAELEQRFGPDNIDATERAVKLERSYPSATGASRRRRRR